MVRKCCPACCGIGSYLGREWIRDGSGVSIYKKVSVRRTCELCEGSGRVVETEELHTHACDTRHVRRPVRAERMSVELEQKLGYFIFLALVGYASFVWLTGHYAVSSWPKISIALMASVILLFFLNHFSAATRFLRWCTLAFFLMIVCGGVVLEFARR